jgi:putative ABC transport system permease protein
VSLFSLGVTLTFVVLAMLLSIGLKLGVEKDMLIATVRSAVQLLVIGYILQIVFSAQHVWFILLIVTVMILVAAQNASKRGKGLPQVFWRVLIAITLTEIVTQGLLLGLHVVSWTPQYIIPISGMIIGNAMVVSGLLLNRLQAEANARKNEILVLLSLGATPRQSSRFVLKQAIRAAMIPTIDGMKTMGLVQLPGMMTGQIIAGADPVQAVRYQLLIVFAFIASAALTSIALGYLTYPTLFNEQQQLMIRSDG